MKQFVSMLVAAAFAVASMTALAQDNKADKMDKKMQKSGKMKTDKAAKKAPRKAAAKKGDAKKEK